MATSIQSTRRSVVTLNLPPHAARRTRFRRRIAAVAQVRLTAAIGHFVD